MNGKSMTDAGSRLRVVGTAAALLAWTIAIAEPAILPLLVIFDFAGVQAEYLESYGEKIPLLLEPGHKISSLVLALVVLAEMVPMLMSATAMYLIGLFFHRICHGQTWTMGNIKLLWWCGLLSILSTLFWPLTETFQVLALSSDLPDGERVLSVSFGTSSEALSEIIIGILLCAFSMLMRDAKTIIDEQKAYV